jgi:hypothetical protein
MSNQETKAFQATQLKGNLESVQEKFKSYSNERKQLAKKSCVEPGNFTDVPLATIAGKLKVLPSSIYHVDRARFTLHTLIVLLRDGSQRNLIM